MPILPANDSSYEFLSHMQKNQRSIRNYITNIHPHSQDLDDLVQQTALTLWREFEKHDATREFLPWALRIACFEVLRLRKQRSRDRDAFNQGYLFDALPHPGILVLDSVSKHATPFLTWLLCVLSPCFSCSCSRLPRRSR
jgi:DNA-directed RNA polymerase specialized sigma24 family protein